MVTRCCQLDFKSPTLISGKVFQRDLHEVGRTTLTGHGAPFVNWVSNWLDTSFHLSLSCDCRHNMACHCGSCGHAFSALMDYTQKP